MADHALCPRCRQANPPENRFCGSCGVALEAGRDLAVRRENNLKVMSHALPTRLGPAGKALAVGLITLAAEAGLSWLRHRTKAERSPLTLTTRESSTAVSERLLAQSLEAVLIKDVKGHRSRVIAWRAIRSIV